jgi:hypothetical protein
MQEGKAESTSTQASVNEHHPHIAVGVKEALLKLQRYILGNRYRGYDPYDALLSPIFNLPLLRSNRIIRFAAQQAIRRFPLNIRPMLGIGKGYNPVTLGLCAHAFAYLTKVFPENREYADEMRFCIDELDRLRSKGYSGACWGYDFDWEGKYSSFPAYTPTVVATGIITNGLFAAYSLTGNRAALELCKSAVKFVLSDLHRSYDGDTFCFSYSPRDTQQVLNATMKAARLLVQVASVTDDRSILSEAAATVRFVLRHQRPEGSWPYAVGDTREWADNFHTGYILDGLEEYMRLSGDASVHDALQRGIRFYTDHFFTSDGVPAYYSNSLHPIDATAGAQSILTLTRFGMNGQAGLVADWMIRNMQSPDGSFYYQKHKWYTNRISYMRWSNAWMFVALAFLVHKGIRESTLISTNDR